MSRRACHPESEVNGLQTSAPIYWKSRRRRTNRRTPRPLPPWAQAAFVLFALLNCLQGTPWLTQTISSRDGRGRITAENSTISGTTVLSESLGWRNDDRLSSYTASGSLTVSGTASTLNYAYDTRGQIQTEPYQLTPTSLQTETYLFDATVSGTMSSLTPSSNNEGGLGVRTVQWRSPVGDNVANAQNTFAQVTQDNFNLNSSYDQVGNVTSWGPSGSAKTLTWDSFNRLVQVVSSSGTWTATYDGLGRRVQTKNGAGSTITYFYDPQVEFLQLGNNNGGSRAWNVYGPDRSGVYGGMQGVGGLEAVITEGTTTVNGVTNDYFGDALAAPGSTTRFSAVVGGYGAMPGSSAVNSSLQAQWRGEYIDPTGLYYMGARYYEPNSGRFLSADPLGHAASMDLYSFANGDPVNGFDPDGRNSAPGAANVESSPSTNYGQDMIGLAGPSSLQDNSAILQDHLDLLQAEDSVQTTANTLLGLANLATFVAAPEAEPELLSAEVAGGVLPKAAELTGSESPIVAGDMGLGEYGPVAPPAAAGIKVAPPGVAGWTADGSPLLGGVPQSMYNAAAEEAGGAGKVFYHYTTADESSFANGLWEQTSVTDKLYTDPIQASRELGIPIPDKVIPIQDAGQFVPNKPFIVEPSPRGPGGGTDFVNPERVPASQILPAQKF